MLPEELKYTKEHEWVRVEGNVATIGITDYAQEQLGDIVYVELPEPGSDTEQMKQFGTIEAVKTVADLFAPVTGKVLEINEKLSSDPTIINHSPYEQGWILKIELSVADEVGSLLSAADYQTLIGS
jgi:glycine cleavage system H protein